VQYSEDGTTWLSAQTVSNAPTNSTITVNFGEPVQALKVRAVMGSSGKQGFAIKEMYIYAQIEQYAPPVLEHNEYSAADLAAAIADGELTGTAAFSGWGTERYFYCLALYKEADGVRRLERIAIADMTGTPQDGALTLSATLNLDGCDASEGYAVTEFLWEDGSFTPLLQARTFPETFEN
jgi:hypothetical protein